MRKQIVKETVESRSIRRKEKLKKLFKNYSYNSNDGGGSDTTTYGGSWDLSGMYN